MQATAFVQQLIRQLEQFVPQRRFGEWIFEGATTAAYNGPGGGWAGYTGYLFRKASLSLILRPLTDQHQIPRLALESDTRRRQLANLKLDKAGIFYTDQSRVHLCEPYTMTVSKFGKWPRKEVKDAMKAAGFEGPVITLFDEHGILWDKIIEDILNWAEKRETVKVKLLEEARAEEKQGDEEVEEADEAESEVESVYEFDDRYRSRSGRAKGAIKNEMLCLPALIVLNELQKNSDAVTLDEINILLEKRLTINDADVIVSHNSPEWKYRVRWALNNLKNCGLVEKKENGRGWSLLNDGRKLLAQLDLTDEKYISTETKEQFYSIISDRLHNKTVAPQNRPVRYWAGGFGRKGEHVYDRLEDFIENNYWQAIDFKEDDEQPAALRTRDNFKAIEPGDYFLIKGLGGYHTLKVWYAGRVVSKDDEEERLQLEPLQVKLYHGPAPRGADAGNWWGTLLEVKRQDIIDQLFFGKTTIDNSAAGRDEYEKPPYPLNQILYGPPGTGKTFETISMAVHIATGSKIDNPEHCKSKFDECRQNGLIEFITFHPSYTYEDFVIGLRPDNGSAALKFTTHEGIFYKLCKKAEENFILSTQPNEQSEQKRYPFDEVIDKVLEPLEHTDANGKTGEVIIHMKREGLSYKITKRNEYNLDFTKPSGGDTHKISLNTLRDYYYNIRPVRRGLSSYYAVLLDVLLQTEQQLIKEKTVTDNATPLQNYVLIIDEINRANISRVFGELITLLEEDKRLGEPYQLRVKLPHSNDEGEQFGVPPNLYIIGTMNTADRSIAMIDLALRRRFEFIGMYPGKAKLEDLTRESLLEEKAEKFLLAINQNLYEAKNSNADYLIGHAYFINRKEAEIPEIILKKIIPLLMEYFNQQKAMVISAFEHTGFSAEYDSQNYTWKVSSNG